MNELVPLPSRSLAVPALVAAAGDQARVRFLEFFAATIRITLLPSAECGNGTKIKRQFEKLIENPNWREASSKAAPLSLWQT